MHWIDDVVHEVYPQSGCLGPRMAASELRAISKAFGSVRVLHGVDLDVLDGEFLTLVGPSGCGKSTLIRIIAGLESQDAGHVPSAGARVDHLRPFERKVAMVFQNYALYPHMTVFRTSRPR